MNKAIRPLWTRSRIAMKKKGDIQFLPPPASKGVSQETDSLVKARKKSLVQAVRKGLRASFGLYPGS